MFIYERDVQKNNTEYDLINNFRILENICIGYISAEYPTQTAHNIHWTSILHPKLIRTSMDVRWTSNGRPN
ncbi:hypothetical protein NQ317_019950 [Molorchus minor]|uniref:Uncharacterized protein n=1 Tax=Molorchus minor TaxID=1323400 RepID=A0ABQ9IQR8_9CUCU|nr:hypothetical protein NQ317_019950 [Molorchus minor]